MVECLISITSLVLTRGGGRHIQHRSSACSQCPPHQEANTVTPRVYRDAPGIHPRVQGRRNKRREAFTLFDQSVTVQRDRERARGQSPRGRAGYATGLARWRLLQ
jgi:hypothetical protein